MRVKSDSVAVAIVLMVFFFLNGPDGLDLHDHLMNYLAKGLTSE